MAQQNPHQEAYIDGGILPNTQESIFAQIECGLLKSPHQPAIICMHQGKDDLEGLIVAEDEPLQATSSQDIGTNCLVLTYTQLHRTALKIVVGLAADGVRPGSTVLCMIPNTVEYAVLLWACALMRLTLAAIDPAVLEERDQLPDYIENLKPEVIFASGTNGPPAIDLAISKCPGLCQPSLRVLIGGDTNCVFRQWKPFWNLLRTEVSASVSSGNELAPIEEARRDDPKRIHSILFTSGTSASRPKGCPLTVRSMTHILNSQSWLINANNCARVLQQAHNARAIASYHTLQTWRVGGAVVMSTGRSFAIQHTLDAIRNHGVTFMVLSPAMVHAIAPALLSLGCAADSVRAIQVGGDAVTKEVLARCTALFPRAQVFINHGMSEGGGFFTWPFFDTPIAQIPYLGEICPVGSVARGTHVRIWNSERKSTALFRQPGELHISCDSLISGYINGVEGSSFYLDDSEMHWINTGDVAMATEEGLVYILGRCKDAIKRGGVAIMPAALESCIENYTGAQTCVVAVPNPALGHEPFAVLTGLEGFTKHQIRDHVLHTFGPGYTLGDVLSLQQVGLNEFPVNATHKILKLRVQNAVLDYLATKRPPAEATPGFHYSQDTV